MQALGDQRRLRQAAGPRDDLFLERVERVRPGARRQFSKGRMQPQQVIDRSAERRLPAVDEPLIRGERAEMRSPDPVDEIAARRTSAMQLDDVPRINARRRRGSACTPPARAPSVPAAPACASISPAPTGVPGLKPIAAAASGVNPRPSGAPGGAVLAPMRA